jgi:hypothetical protein
MMNRERMLLWLRTRTGPNDEEGQVKETNTESVPMAGR